MIHLIDLFCGAGGVSTGASLADGLNVIACVNHDANAIKSHAANHPECKHYTEDIRTLDLGEMQQDVISLRNSNADDVIGLWASLECTNFSRAKGGKARDADSRTLADHLIRYIEVLSPDIIYIENVVEFMSWGPLDDNGKPISKKAGCDYMKWINTVKGYGYTYDYRILNAADFGAYTSRKRFFAQFAKAHVAIEWPKPTHQKKGKQNHSLFGNLQPWKPVREVLQLEQHGKSIFGRAKNLSDRTYERIYHGLIKFVAGGKDAFMVKYHGGIDPAKRNRTHSVDQPLTTVDTQNRHYAVQAEFMLKYNSINGKTGVHHPPSVEEPCPTVAAQARLGVVQTQFLTKHFSGHPESKNISVDAPAGTVKPLDNHTLETVQFIHQRNSGEPGSKVKSIEEPARTVTQTGGNQELVTSDFIVNYQHSSNSNSLEEPSPTITCKDKYAFVSAYHGNGSNVHSADGPAPTIPCKDSVALVQPQQFIARDFSGGGQLNDIESAAGAVLSTPKMNLVTPEAFLMKGMFGTGDSQSKSLEEPSPTLTASRHAYYLMNPQYSNVGGSVENPAFTLIARMDKQPPYLIVAENGEVAIAIEEGDTEHMIKIKEFMAMYGIVDIYMRMLFIEELKSIQGFPKDYVLIGNQAEQKKFLGNAVEVNQAKVILQASAHANFPNLKEIAA